MKHALTIQIEKLDISRSTLAAECGVSRNTIYNIENGRIQNPRLDLIAKLIAAIKARGGDLSADSFLQVEPAE